MNRTKWTVACGFLLLLSACSPEENAGEAPEQVEVSAQVVHRADVPVRVNLPGRLEAYRQAEVKARVTGIIQKRCYQEGARVKKGDTLFLIEPTELKAAVDKCEAACREAEVAWVDARDKAERYAALVKTGAVSTREYNLARAEEAKARASHDSSLAALEQARIDLGYARVEAPIDGRVRRAQVTEGALASKDGATSLTYVEQIDPVYVRFSQTAAQYNESLYKVKSGEWVDIPLEKIEAKLILSGGMEYPHAGTIFFADAAVDPETDAIEMRAQFPNPDGELLPGSFVRITFDQAKFGQAFLVPRDSLQRTSKGAFVYVVREDGTLELRAVTAESLHGREWIVTDGLKEGERIVTSRPDALHDGMRVEIRPAREADAKASPEEERKD